MRIAQALFRALAALAILVCVLFALAQAHVFAPSSPLVGVSYLPPWWLFGLVLPATLGCAALRSGRWAAATALAFALLVLPHADVRLRSGHTAEATAPAQRLSVVALNVQYYSHGLENVVAALRELDPDVVLLSENVLDAADAARAKALWAPRDFRMGRSGETAIASRFPILEFHEIDLPTAQASLSGPNEPGSAPQERRSFSHAVIDVHGTRVNVISLRLIAGRAPEGGLRAQIDWGIYLVQAQAREVEAFRRYASTLKGPVIFGGDMNAPPSASAISALRVGYEDAFLARNHFGVPTFRVHPAPYLRLDYVFINRDVTALSARRIDREMSDHFAVAADLAIRKGGQ